MSSKALFFSALVATTYARFGQEQAASAAVAALSNRGNPGDAGTLSGSVPGVLLAGANACAKLTLADKIVSTLGTTPDVIAAALGVVGAEKNFNPFAVSVPSLCSDPSLPATAELRGVVPLVDPAVTGSDVENANAKASLTTPFNADGLSVADVASANGFTNFTSQAADGSAGGAAAASPAAGGAKASAAASSAAGGAAASSAATTSAAGAAATAVSGGGAANSSDTAGGAASGSAASGLDFGQCVPTMKFEAGLNGRKDTEFTFQAIDPLVNKGQQEALNPNIITNRICDQLGNVCNASQAAKDACTAAKAQIQALGTRDKSTADAWNTALGFAGADTNPDNAPQAGLVGHT